MKKAESQGGVEKAEKQPDFHFRTPGMGTSSSPTIWAADKREKSLSGESDQPMRKPKDNHTEEIRQQVKPCAQSLNDHFVLCFIYEQTIKDHHSFGKNISIIGE